MELLTALPKLKRVRANTVDPDASKYEFLPNTCADLFWGAPWSTNGQYLLHTYVAFRNGDGVTDPNGHVPCSEGAAAWTTCCNHDKYIFLCNSFQNLSSSDRIYTVIHEVMHVAGQKEDTNSTFGPSNPPNPSQITAAVRSACQ